MPAPQPNNTDDRLLRGIGRWALTAFAINLTVGSGILGLPAKIQALVGNYSVPIIVACGLLMALIALCFAEVGSRFDRTGGPQLYASQALGATAGFTVGWLLWISRIGSCAAVSNLAVDYGKVLWPQLAHPGIRALAITLLVLGYTWINIRGIRQTAAVNTTFTVLKIVPLVAFVAIGLFFVEPRRCGWIPCRPPRIYLPRCCWPPIAFVGFDGTTVLAGEVRDPRRSVPFAILFSVGCVIVLYTLIQLVCVGTLPNLAASERPLADVALLLVGPVGAIVIAVVAVISCAGVFGASMTPGTRLLFSMGDDRQLPHPLAHVHCALPHAGHRHPRHRGLDPGARDFRLVHLPREDHADRAALHLRDHLRHAAHLPAHAARAGGAVRIAGRHRGGRRVRASVRGIPREQLHAGVARCRHGHRGRARDLLRHAARYTLAIADRPPNQWRMAERRWVTSRWS